MGFHKQRGEARTAIAVMARLRVGNGECEAFLANASSRGVMAIVAKPPRRGTRVELQVGDDLLTGRVRWVGAGRCGIALNETIRVPPLAKGVEPGTSLILSRGPVRSGLLGAIAGDQQWHRLSLILVFAAVAGTFIAISRLGHRADDRDARGIAPASERAR